MPTVGVHEAYPGHHTQFGRANRAPTLARRVAFIPDGGTLLIEGWAFYCEEMMEAQGFLVAPGVRLMRLNDQLWRACRVVIDMELQPRPHELRARPSTFCRARPTSTGPRPSSRCAGTSAPPATRWPI